MNLEFHGEPPAVSYSPAKPVFDHERLLMMSFWLRSDQEKRGSRSCRVWFLDPVPGG